MPRRPSKMDYTVFPASAGVILISGYVNAVERGFPRTCGGDPKLTAISSMDLVFSPHLRG